MSLLTNLATQQLPVTVTRQEIIHLLGRTARISSGHSIHFIMDRSSGKAEQCYVEFDSVKYAEAAVERANHTINYGEGPRIGLRPILVSLANQDDMMKALFPFAKNIRWNDGKPTLLTAGMKGYLPDEFPCFVTDEQMYCTLRHAEDFQRVRSHFLEISWLI